MNRPIILYIGISLDGMIAAPNGGVDWLGGEDPHLDSDYGYNALMEEVDTILMGWTTYHQIVTQLSPNIWPYEGKETIVFTHTPPAPRKGISFTAEEPCQLVRRLGAQPGKSIWICGGASLAQQLAAGNLIDQYRLSIMPILLGTGIPLFQNGLPTHLLHLESCQQENGVITCTYTRR